MFLVIILYFFFASTFTFAKAALDYSPPLFLVAVRFIMAGIILLFYHALLGTNNWHIQKKDYSLFAQAIFFTFYLSFTTDVWALQYIASAKACLIYNISPFITAIIAYILYKKQISSKQIIALIIGFLAFIPLLTNFSCGQFNISLISSAEIVLLISVTSACYGWFILKKLIVDRGYSSVLVNGIGVLGGGFMALIHALVGEGIPTIQSHGAYQPPAILNLMEKLTGPVYLDLGMFTFYTILLVFIAHIFCYNLYVHLLKKYSATFLSLSGALTPLFAALLGWLFLDEPLSQQFFVTMGAVSAALYIFYQDEWVTKIQA